MDEEVDRRRERSASPETLAFRAEQKLMAPFRKQIGGLQNRVAFIMARSASSRTHSPEEYAADIEAVAEAIEVASAEIDSVLEGRSRGPADNCRKALEILRLRVASLRTT